MFCCSVHLLILLCASLLLGSCIPQLIAFISSQGLLGSPGLNYPMMRTKHLKDWTEFERKYVTQRLFKDFLLVNLFMLQHSLMANERWKKFLMALEVVVSERLLYVIASCFTLNMLMSRWESTPDVLLWTMDTDEYPFHWLFFFVVHFFGWLIIFLQVAIMDPWELIGVQQLYNHYRKRSNPLNYMDRHLVIYYQHLRHAGMTGLCLMLWVHPVMTLDRFLLALIFSLYMALAHCVSLADYKFATCYFMVEETTTRHKLRR